MGAVRGVEGVAANSSTLVRSLASAPMTSFGALYCSANSVIVNTDANTLQMASTYTHTHTHTHIHTYTHTYIHIRIHIHIHINV